MQLLVLAASALVALGLTLFVRRVSLRTGAMTPQVRKRDVHAVPIPRSGGVAIWASVTVMLLAVWVAAPELLVFPGLPDGFLPGILAGLLVLLAAGLWDDVRGLAPLLQIVALGVAGFTLVLSGVEIPFLRIPYAEDLTLGSFASGLFVVLWVAAIGKAYDLADGVDGLAGSLCFVAALTLAVLSLRFDLTGPATLAFVAAGVSLGFLVLNWYPAKIHMGTTGAFTLSFLLAATAVASGGKVATTLLVLGLPVFDAIGVVLRRLRAGAPVFQADQRHFHHRLLQLGCSPAQVALISAGIALMAGALALATQTAEQKGIALVALIIFLGLVTGGTYWLAGRRSRTMGG